MLVSTCKPRDGWSLLDLMSGGFLGLAGACGGSAACAPLGLVLSSPGALDGRLWLLVELRRGWPFSVCGRGAVDFGWGSGRVAARLMTPAPDVVRTAVGMVPRLQRSMTEAL